MTLRVIGETVVQDRREFYSFRTLSGRRVEMKADSIEEAREKISACLEIQVKELTYDSVFSEAA